MQPDECPFEIIDDEEWEGPQRVAIPDMVWPTKQSFPVINHHLSKNREQLRRPTRKVQRLIGPNCFRRGFPMNAVREMPDWEQEQFWVWMMPMLYTSTMAQLNQYLAWLRQGGVVSSYHGHMAATELYQVCKAIVRERNRRKV